MKQSKSYPLLAVILLLLTAVACGLGDSAGPEVVVETVVVVATPTPEPEEEQAGDEIPELTLPVAALGEPKVIALVGLNVRQGPGTVYGVVGALREGSSARILGTNPLRTWWRIECPAGHGECWVSGGRQFSTAENAEMVPVVAVPPAPTHPAPTAVYTETATPAATYTSTATMAADMSPTPTATTDPAATLTYTPTATATYTPTPTPSPSPTIGAYPP